MTLRTFLRRPFLGLSQDLLSNSLDLSRVVYGIPSTPKAQRGHLVRQKETPMWLSIVTSKPQVSPAPGLVLLTCSSPQQLGTLPSWCSKGKRMELTLC
jgi:hypothetical protein